MKKTLLIIVALVTGIVPTRAQSHYFAHIEPLQHLDCQIPFTKPPFTGDTTVACKENRLDYQLCVGNPDSCGWSVTGGTIVPGGVSGNMAVVTVQWDAVDQGVLSATAIDGDGDTCRGELIVSLVDRPQARCQSSPSYVFDMRNGEKVLTVCKGNPVIFTDISSSGSSEILYNYWSCDQGTSTNTTFTVNPQTMGDYTLYHRVTNVCGCYGEEKIKIVVREDCPLELSCHGIVCAHAQERYQAISPTCAEYNWIAEGGFIVDAAADWVEVVWDDTESGYGTLTLIGGACNCPCPDKKSVRIPVVSGSATITGLDTVCLRTAHTFSVPLWGSTQYTWHSGGDTSVHISGGSPDYNEVGVFFTQTGTHTIELTYECTALGCGPYHARKTVVVLDSIRIFPPSTSAVCPDSTAAFWCDAPRGEPLEWRVYHNNALVMHAEGDTCTCSFGEDGVYLIELQGANHCNVARHQLTVLPRPRTPSLQEQYACPRSAIYLNDDNVPAHCYAVWSAIEQPDVRPQQAQGNSVAFTYGNRLCDFEVYYVDMLQGCRSLPDTQRVSKPLLRPSGLPGTIYMCQNQTLELSVPDQTSQGVLYRWAADSAHHVTVVGSELEPSVIIEATINERDAQPYTRHLTLTRSYCDTTVSETVLVIVGETHNPVIQQSDSLVCPGTTVHFWIDNASAGSADAGSCYWTINNEGTPRYPGLSLDLTVQDTSTVKFHYVAATGCITGAASATVAVRNPPEAHIDLNGDVVQIVPDSNLYTYAWNDGTTTPSTTYNPHTGNCCRVTDILTGCSTVVCYTPDAGDCEPDTLVAAHSADCACVNISFSATISSGELHVSKGNRDTTCVIRNQNHFTFCAREAGPYSFRVISHDSDPCIYQNFRDTVRIVPKVSVKTLCDSSLEITNCTQFYPSSNSVDGFVHITGGTGMTNVPQPPMQLPVGQSVTVGRSQLSDGTTYTIIMETGNCACTLYYTYLYPPAPTYRDTIMPSACCYYTPYLFAVSSNGNVGFRWEFDDGVVDYGDSVYHSFVPRENEVVGFRSVSLTITGANGCALDLTKEISVGSEEVKFSGETVNPTCLGIPIQIRLHNLRNNIGEYCWYALGNCITVAEGVVNTHCTVDNAGNYTVLAVSRTYHCREERIVSATNINPPPAIIVAKDAYCFGEPVSVSGFCGASYTYRWRLFDTNGDVVMSQSAANATFSGLNPGDYSLRLTVTDPGTSCCDSAEKTITLLPSEPTPSIDSQGSSCLDQGPVAVEELNGRSLYWNNGQYGPSATYYRPGEVSAYYLNPATQCSSNAVTLSIDFPPEMDAFLSGCYDLCDPVALHIPLLSADGGVSHCDLLRNGSILLPYLQLPATINLNASGEYNLSATYGSGCGPVQSELLSLNVQSCPDPPLACLVVFLKTEGPILKQCKIVYRVMVYITNNCSDVVSIDGVGFSPILAYTTQTSFPLTVAPNGGTACIMLDVVYDIMPLNCVSFRLSANGLGVVRNEPLVFSGWDANINSCGLEFQSLLGSPEPLLGIPYQSEYYRFSLGFPNAISSCLAVWLSCGTVVRESWSSPYDADILTLFDYGRLTQMAYYGECIRIKALVCIKQQLCIIDTCISAQMLVNAAEWASKEGLQSQNGSQIKHEPQVPEGSPHLVPNPGSGRIQVVSPNPIQSIEVISMLGKRMLRAEGSLVFDASGFPQGAYIVVVVSEDNEIHYLKFIKQ